MNDDRRAHEDASTEATRPGEPNGNRGEQGGGEPAQALADSTAQGATVRGEHADSPASTDAAEKKPPKRARSFWRELPVLIVVALVIALVIKTFVVQAFFIPSSSMENTLEVGDKVLVNKLVYHFRAFAPGDIIVFNGDGSWDPVPSTTASSNPVARLYDATLQPLLRSIAGLFGTAPGQTDFIKRVMGVPGDRVACCTAQGLMTVNGVPLHEKSYLYPGNAPGSAPTTAAGSFRFTVPPGRLWVMGDHRSVSEDSRLHRGDPGGGTIPENKVIGRAAVIVWPPSRWHILPIPSTFARPGIDSLSATADFGAPVAPAAPYLPVGAGFALAFPLTWLLRRLRHRDPRRPGHHG